MIDETRRRKECEEEREREREGGRERERVEGRERERAREEGKKGRIRVGDEKEGMVKCRGTRMSKKKN